MEEDAKLFLHQALSTPCLAEIRHAEGLWIEDRDGRRYMDFHGNNVHHVGYGHPDLKTAIRDQLDTLSFAPRRFTNAPAVALARKLVEITPPPLEKVLFATGGSDAVEIALKLARARTGRYKTLSFWDSFHGAGFAASSLGGEDTFRSAPIGPLLAGSEHVAPFYCYRCPYGHPDREGVADIERCGMACAEMIDYVLEKEGDIAAVVAEPVRAAPLVPPRDFWRRVRAACDAHGAVLIFDEIPTGLGKTGRMFAFEHFGVVPDILVLGKGLGGGMLPIAAVVARAEFDIGGNWAFGHYTHEKNPITARVALETIAIIEREELVANAERVGRHAMDRLTAMKEQHPLIGNVRGLGLILGLELVEDPATRAPAPDAAEETMYLCLERGLSFKVVSGNVLALTPPLTISVEEMDDALTILESALSEVEGRRRLRA